MKRTAEGRRQAVQHLGRRGAVRAWTMPEPVAQCSGTPLLGPTPDTGDERTAAVSPCCRGESPSLQADAEGSDAAAELMEMAVKTSRKGEGAL